MESCVISQSVFSSKFRSKSQAINIKLHCFIRVYMFIGAWLTEKQVIHLS